jgi:formiminoglutamase
MIKPLRADSVVKNAVVLRGYPDDEGIKLNGGRPGAKAAPEHIRKILFKMTPSLSGAQPVIWDAGDLEITGDLNSRHSLAEIEVKKLLEKEARVVTMGGGHDYGYPDFAAFCDFCLARGKKPFIINFDAHLDVRPDEKGAHSGTPFYKLLKKYSSEIDFFEVGIQDWCNSKFHLEWALEKGAHVVTFEEIMSSQEDLESLLSRKILSQFTRDHELALSLDIDGLPSGTAPGASQVFPVGLEPRSLLNFWRTMSSRFSPKLMGVYEVSPAFDLDDRTSRLGALFIHQFIFAGLK